MSAYEPTPADDADRQERPGLPRDAGERLTFLSQASARLNSSLEAPGVVGALADLAVPALADWCTIRLVDEEGAITRVAVVCADERKRPLAERLAENFPTDPTAPAGVAEVIRTGQPQLYQRVAEQLLVDTAIDDEYLAITLALGFRSAMLVPLVARGRVLGAITLVAAESDRLYDESDLRFAGDVAALAALALDNAVLHAEVVRAHRQMEDILHSLDAIVWEAVPGRLVFSFVNRRAEDLLGYPVSRWLEEEGFWATLLHPDDLEATAAGLRRALKEGSEHELEYRVIGRDGRLRWVRDHVRVDRDEHGRAVLLRGVAVDVTDAKQRERELRLLATTLQASLLPARIPVIEHVDLAAAYRPAVGQGVTVGGDFYDVFHLADDDWGVVVGDVCGKGSSAATLTGLVRYAIRGAAVHEQDPAGVLAEVNAVVLDEEAVGERFATVLFARLTPHPNRLRIAVGHAGHVPPLVVRHDGRVETVAADSMPLGLFEDAVFGGNDVELELGDMLVLLTDGVTEARAPTGSEFCDVRLRQVLESAVGKPASEVVRMIEAESLAFAGGANRDDMAIVVLALAR